MLCVPFDDLMDAIVVQDRKAREGSVDRELIFGRVETKPDQDLTYQWNHHLCDRNNGQRDQQPHERVWNKQEGNDKKWERHDAESPAFIRNMADIEYSDSHVSDRKDFVLIAEK